MQKQSEIRVLMFQILKQLPQLHKNIIFHSLQTIHLVRADIFLNLLNMVQMLSQNLLQNGSADTEHQLVELSQMEEIMIGATENSLDSQNHQMVIMVQFSLKFLALADLLVIFSSLFVHELKVYVISDLQFHRSILFFYYKVQKRYHYEFRNIQIIRQKLRVGQNFIRKQKK